MKKMNPRTSRAKKTAQPEWLRLLVIRQRESETTEQRTVRVLIFRIGRSTWWLPQLDSISFRIGYPGKATVFVIDRILNRHTFFTECSQQAIEIGDTIVDHERRCAWIEVFGVLRKWCPNGLTN